MWFWLIVPPGAITGRTFQKTDDGENPGLEKWTIILKDSNGNEFTTTTLSDGQYSFEDVEPGAYIVEEERRPGWRQIEPGTTVYSIEIKSGLHKTNINFVNKPELFIEKINF